MLIIALFSHAAKPTSNKIQSKTMFKHRVNLAEWMKGKNRKCVCVCLLETVIVIVLLKGIFFYTYVLPDSHTQARCCFACSLVYLVAQTHL